MKITNDSEYLWIEPENEKEVNDLKNIFESAGDISLAVNTSGNLLALKIWKEKRK